MTAVVDMSAHVVAPAGAVVLSGRPRSAAVDKRITLAALEVLADVGPDALSVESVAARAEVSKATIYRRYTGKSQLVSEALASLVHNCASPDQTLSTRDALVQILERIRSVDANSLQGRVMRRIVGVGLTHPDLHRSFHDRFVSVRRARIIEVLERGRASGELRNDIDVELATTALVGGLVMSVLGRRDDFDPAPPGTVERLVDLVLNGMVPAAN